MSDTQSVVARTPDASRPLRWRRFPVGPGQQAAWAYTAVAVSRRTRFQRVEILDTVAFGRALFLDGLPQSAEADEFIYHEALVHPAMVCHPAPRSVFIGGGADGGALREALRYPGLERVRLVDIDGELVKLCQQYLPYAPPELFADPRATVTFGDAHDALMAAEPGTFDVVILDLTDPGTPLSRRLYTPEFFGALAARLRSPGVLVLQAGSLRLTNLHAHLEVVRALRGAFRVVRSYWADVPFFGEVWGFAFASNYLDPASLSAGEVDRRLEQRGVRGLRFYDGQTHTQLFALPRYVRAALGEA